MLKSQPREVMVGLAGILVILFAFAVGKVNSTIVLITASNFSLPFFNIEASFAPQVPAIGIQGVVFAAEPSNACKPLQIRRPNEVSAFLLVERGECDFVTKVKNAQDAGYTAAIISNNKDGQDLVTMSGSGTGINIFAVFVSKQVGRVLQLCAGNMDCRCYLFPPFENTARSAVSISFISLITFFAVSLTLFFARRHCLRLTGPGPLQAKPRGMPPKEIEALPVILFDIEVNATVETCTICLEEYTSGEKLRVLPCGHEFHVACIDQWLTTWRTFCPICKQDARCKRANEPPSEHIPLLGSFAVHSCCMASSVPASDQNSQIRSPVQNPDCFVNSLTSLHAAEQFLFHPISQFCELDDEAPLSSSHIPSTVAASSTLSIPHNICYLNRSPCACHMPSSADSSTSVVEGEVVIQMTSTE